MDISDQTVKEHYGELLGIGKEWELSKVLIEHGAEKHRGRTFHIDIHFGKK